MAFDPITAGLDFGKTLVKRLLPDKEAQQKAEATLDQMALTGELQAIMSGLQVVKAEAESEHWLTSNWRPITMLVFVFIIANNYILYPYLALFFDTAPKLDIPPDMWGLLKIGLGGYVIGRSVEKGVKEYKK